MQNNERLAYIKSYISTTNKIYETLKDDVANHLKKAIDDIGTFGLTYEILKNNAYRLDDEQIDYIQSNIISNKEIETDMNLFNELNDTSKSTAIKITNTYINFIDLLDSLKFNLQNLSKFETDIKFSEYLQEQEESFIEFKQFITSYSEKIQNNFSDYKKFTSYSEHKEMIDIKFDISKMTAFTLTTDTDDEFKNSIKLI